MFILTARLPDYDNFLEKMTNIYEGTRYSIIKFTENQNLRYQIPPFTEKEIESFVRLYGQDNQEQETIEKRANKIFNDTKGHPILVKFFVLGDSRGLSHHVENMLKEYLIDDPRIETMLVCSILNLADLPITDNLLNQLGIMKYAYYLEQATLRHRNKFWETIHWIWNVELLLYLYSVKKDNSDKMINERVIIERHLCSDPNINYFS